MKIPGYSDRTNHAFAFAAKHHDQKVRRGTSLPYLTKPANVALILTRYGQDESTVVAGILHDVVEDFVRERRPLDTIERRVGDKFGHDVLGALLHVVERLKDDDDVELSGDERKEDAIARLANAPEASRWVTAANALHSGGTLLADLRRTQFPETVWGRFSIGREGTVRWYRRIHDRLAAIGFDAPIMTELHDVAEALSLWGGTVEPALPPATARAR